MSDLDRSASPGPSAEEVRRRLASELALPSRLGHTALLLVASASATLVASLLLTEPALPTRTRVAFGVMILIGLAWAGFAGWVLARRRVLFASHRVIAARMAVAFTAVYTVGAAGVASEMGTGAARLLAPALGAGMLAVSIAVLLRARRHAGELARRRQALERMLADREGAGR